MWLILTLMSIAQLTYSWPQYHQYQYNQQQQQQPQQQQQQDQQQRQYEQQRQSQHQPLTQQQQHYDNSPVNASGLPAAASPTIYRHYYPEINKCHDNETGRQLFIGDFFTRPGKCVRVQCLGTLQIWEDRCQIPQLSDNDGERNCSRLPVANEYLDYPRCCPLYECHSHRINKNSETDARQIYDHMGNLVREHITQRILLVLDAQLMNNNNEPIRPVGGVGQSEFHISKTFK